MFENQITAGRKHDLRLEQLLPLLVDAARLEQIARPFPQLEAIQVLWAEQRHRRPDFVKLFLRIDHDLPHVAGHKIANGFEDEIEIFVQERGRSRALVRFEDAVPQPQLHAQVRDEFGFADAARRGSDDGRHTLGSDATHDLFEALAFLVVLDARRDAGVASRRHQDEVAPRQRYVRRDPRAFEAAGLLDDLHENVISDLEQLVDRMAFAPVGYLGFADIDGVAAYVVDVEERIASQTDVDETRAHAGKDVLDSALVDRADDFFFTFKVDFGE